MLCVCVCSCEFMPVCLYMCVCACVFVSTCACMHVCLPLHVCMCLYVHECLSVYVCMCTCVCVCASTHLLSCLRQDLLFVAVSSRLATSWPSGDSLLSSSHVVGTVGLQMCATMSGLTWLLGMQSDPHACPVKFQVPIELPVQPVLSTSTITCSHFLRPQKGKNQLSSSSWTIRLSWDWKSCGRWKILLLVHFRFLLPLQNLTFNGGVQGYKLSLPISATSSF